MSGWNIVYALINFAILAAGLLFIGRKIVSGMIGEHRDGVSASLKGAEKAQESAAALRAGIPGEDAAAAKALVEYRDEVQNQAAAARRQAREASREELEQLSVQQERERLQRRRVLRAEANAQASEEIVSEAAELLADPAFAAAKEQLCERFTARLEKEIRLTDCDRVRMAEEGGVCCGTCRSRQNQTPLTSGHIRWMRQALTTGSASWVNTPDAAAPFSVLKDYVERRLGRRLKSSSMLPKE